MVPRSAWVYEGLEAFASGSGGWIHNNNGAGISLECASATACIWGIDGQTTRTSGINACHQYRALLQSEPILHVSVSVSFIVDSIPAVPYWVEM